MNIKKLCVHFSLSYSARNVQAQYYLWPLSLDNNFSILSCKRHNFRKKILLIKCVFRFSLKICLKYFSFQEGMREI